MTGRKVFVNEIIKILKEGHKLYLPFNPVAIPKFSRALDLGTLIGLCVFRIHIINGFLASLKVPIILVSNPAATVVVSDPPDKTLQLVNKGITNTHSATGGWELGDCGTDIRDILQKHFSKGP